MLVADADVPKTLTVPLARVSVVAVPRMPVRLQVPPVTLTLRETVTALAMFSVPPVGTVISPPALVRAPLTCKVPALTRVVPV